MIVVTTPASSYMLTTRAKVLKKWAGTVPEDDVVDDAILAASRTIAKWCRREFVQQVYTERIEAPERRKLVLSEYPVLADPVPVVTADGESVTNFDVYSDTGMLYRNDGNLWTGPTQYGGFLGASVMAFDREPTLLIVYTAGWITQPMVDLALPAVIVKTLPRDVEDAATWLSKQLLLSDAGKPSGDPSSVRIGNFQTTVPVADSMTGSGSGYWAESIGDPYITSMPLRVRRTLLPYRKMIG